MNWLHKILAKEQLGQSRQTVDNDLQREIEENREQLSQYRHQTQEKEQPEWLKILMNK